VNALSELEVALFGLEVETWPRTSCTPSPSPHSTRPRWPLGRCAAASLVRYRAGSKLIAAGERDFKFLVVESGEVAIVDESGETPTTIAILPRGEFTGDVAHLTGGPSLVSAIAATDCEVYEVCDPGGAADPNR
jgi:hypothetical protein